MFRRTLCVILTSASLLQLPGPASAGPLKPVSSWDLDYGETQCLASRKYGSADDPVTLGFRQSPNGNSYEIFVARRYRVSEPATEEQGTVDFGNGPINAWVLFYQTSNKQFDVHQFRISAADMARARSATDIALHVSGSSDLAFELASMPQLLDGLQACTTDLERYWNMDGKKGREFSRLSRGDVRSVFSADDYPSEAISRGQEGKGQYLLLVDQKGKVAGCQVLTATGVPILDAMACAVIQTRARFTPALDMSGKPVRSAVVTPPINWQLSD